MSYKRNQIEEAIARTFDPNCQEPPSELRTRIKRLLELDPASAGLKMLKRPTLHFSVTRRLALEPISCSRNMKLLHY
jgi:hypothetical protein